MNMQFTRLLNTQPAHLQLPVRLETHLHDQPSLTPGKRAYRELTKRGKYINITL